MQEAQQEQKQDVQGTPAEYMVVVDETQVNQIAMAAHEANRVWCEINGHHTKLPWAQVLGHIRVSTRAGVSNLIMALNAGGQPHPEEQHEQWCVQKLADGWTMGDQYSAENKKHPNLIPWGEISQFEQIKDTIFIDLVITFFNGLLAILMRERKQGQPCVAMPPPNEPGPPDCDTGGNEPSDPATGPMLAPSPAL